VISAFGLREMGPEMIDPDDSTTLARIRDGARLLVGNKRSVIPKRVRASQGEQGVTLFFIFPKEDLGLWQMKRLSCSRGSAPLKSARSSRRKT